MSDNQLFVVIAIVVVIFTAGLIYKQAIKCDGLSNDPGEFIEFGFTNPDHGIVYEYQYKTKPKETTNE